MTRDRIDPPMIRSRPASRDSGFRAVEGLDFLGMELDSPSSFCVQPILSEIEDLLKSCFKFSRELHSIEGRGSDNNRFSILARRFFSLV
jgi:hypothetical protein